MKSRISNIITRVLGHLPSSVQAVLLRKAVAISSEQVKFQNGQITMLGSIENLSAAGFTPNGVIDIGANVGNWTRSVAKIFPNANYHMVEAQPDLAKNLKETTEDLRANTTFTIGLLGAKPKSDVPFYTLGTGSSVFEEVTNLKKEVERLPMTRLDDLPEVKALTGPLFLKLDVQGYELEVLKGAERTLASTEVVLMEVALLHYNKGAPLMPEVLAFMEDRGFSPYDICGQLRRISDRALFQTDVIFVRHESGLRAHRRFSMFEPNEEQS